MKKLKSLWLYLVGVCLLCLNACSESKSEASFSAETSSADSANIAANGDVLLPNERKFVRTADLRFKVKDVQNASSQVRQLAESIGGFTTHSTLSSQVIDSHEIALSEDSVLRNQSFERNSDIIVRIPTPYFDIFLEKLRPLMLYLDSQQLSANDVSLMLVASDLRKKRFSQFEKKYTKQVQAKAKGLAETATAEENLYAIQSEADNKQVETLQLKDQLAYSTVNLHIYQAIQLHHELLPNIDNQHIFRPNVFVGLWGSIKQGWYLFEDLVLLVAKLWVLFLLGGIGYWLLKRKPIQH